MAEPAGGPGGLCDTHFHVFGPRSAYPPLPGAVTVETATLERYEQVTAGCGIDRFVLVQPSGYGTDNRCLLDALERLGPARARAVVAVGDGRPDDATLARWHEMGVRGLRFIGFPPGTATHAAAGLEGRVDGWAAEVRPRLARLVGLAAELGWTVDVLAQGWLVADLLDVLEASPVPVTLAHLAMFPAPGGIGQPGFADVLRLLTDGDRPGWMKLTGPYRISRDPAEADVGALARAVYEAAPDRLIWGSDFPHLSFAGVSTGATAARLSAWFPAEEDRRRIGAGNAARLYGLDGAPGGGATGR